MWDVNLCKIFFSLITSSIVILSVLLNFWESHLPVAVVQSFRYGKFASKNTHPLFQIFEVPKSNFRHFYIVSALIYCPVAFKEVLWVYVFGGKVSAWFMSLLDFSCGYSRTPTVSSSRVFMGITLITLQVIRRLFDTHLVSVFSKKATIHFSAYLIGVVYYAAALLIILSEAPKFTHDVIQSGNLLLLDVGIPELFAVVLFMWAWYHQHVVTVILADLRKNEKGLVVSQEYQLPKGDWFNYVSSPHSSAEIVMYSALTLLLWEHTGWWYVYIWVLSNQVETMLLSHWWYQSHFKDFPKDRKALIPYVY